MTKPTLSYGLKDGFIDDCQSIYGPTPTTGTCTGAGLVTTTVDTSRTEADNYWINGFITYTSGDNMGETKKITDHDQGTTTITHEAFTNVTSAGDTYKISWWGEVEDGNTCAFTVENHDYFKLNVSASAGNETSYVNYPNENYSEAISISSTTYTKIKVRYKTSDTSIKAKVVLVFSDANTQEVLADTSSITWKVCNVTVTSGKTIDHIRLHADHATGQVYYDFAMIHKGDFTFPNTGSGLTFDPSPKQALQPIPSRGGDVSYPLGSNSALVHVRPDMNIGDWTRTGDNIYGQIFLEMAANNPSEPWHWLDTGEHQFKVTLERCMFHQLPLPQGKFDSTVDLMFREKRVSDGNNSLETYVSRYGLDL